MTEPMSSFGTVFLILVGFLVYLYCRRNTFMVSQTLVFINFSVFAMWILLFTISPKLAFQAFDELGFRPAYIETPSFGLLTLITAMFMHGGPMHLLMNMLILILLGVPFEDRVGPRSFLMIYLISGLVGSLLTASISVWNQADDLETLHIGASGAVFGVMGGFVLLYPKDEIPMLLGPIFMHRVPVLLATLVFVAMETLYVGLGTDDGIGHSTHMASFIAGVFLAPYYSEQKEGAESKTGFDTSLLSKVLEETGLGSHELKMIEESDEPELVNAWVDKFWEIQKCPDCYNSLTPKAECSDCGKVFSN